MTRKLHTLATLREHCVIDGKCWLWANVKGRPLVGHDGKIVPARRLARELKDKQPIPEGMLALAKCGNRHCISPACSYIGTPHNRTRDEVARGSYNRPMARIKAAKTRNAKSHITDDMVRAVRNTTGTCKAIAEQLGISKPYVSQLRHNQKRVDRSNPFAGLGARQP